MSTSISLVGAAIFPQTSARVSETGITHRTQSRTDVNKSSVDTIDSLKVFRRNPFPLIKMRLYIHIYINQKKVNCFYIVNVQKFKEIISGKV